jgi:hypothetical protein
MKYISAAHRPKKLVYIMEMFEKSELVYLEYNY